MNVKIKVPRPPKHLQGEGRILWKILLESYDISDEAGLRFLRIACESQDRLAQLQNEIETLGLTIQDRHGQTKPNPLLAAERDCRAQLLASLKALNLTNETDLTKPGRKCGSVWRQR